MENLGGKKPHTYTVKWCTIKESGINIGKFSSINGVGKTEKPHAKEWNSTTIIYYTPN